MQELACRAVAREASEGWWSQAGSNRRPRECHSRALPSELWPHSRTRLPPWDAAEISAFFFFLDRLTDDVCNVGVAFFLFFDERGIVHALVAAHLDFFFFARRGRSVGRRRLLALLLGLGIFERNKFGVCGLRHDG